jgi:hypothetical protein
MNHRHRAANDSRSTIAILLAILALLGLIAVKLDRWDAPHSSSQATLDSD